MLVLNDPTRMCCGLPAAQCTCGTSHNDSAVANAKPEPLGLPDWNDVFENEAAQQQQQHADELRQQGKPQQRHQSGTSPVHVQNDNVPRPAGGPLGLPVWEF